MSTTKNDSWTKARKTVGTTKETILRVLTCPMSRNEIVTASGLKLQTVCGAVNRMIKEGSIKVVWEKVDHESRHRVEVLVRTDDEVR